MTTNLGELLRRKLDADKKKEEKDKYGAPLRVVVSTSHYGEEVNHVAVLVADYGRWFTYHGIEELLYDPYIVHMVEQKDCYMGEDYDRPGWTDEQKNKWEEDVIGYCRRTYPDAEVGFLGTTLGLSVMWVRVGRRFVVTRNEWPSGEENSGECLMFEDTVGWLDAGRRSV